MVRNTIYCLDMDVPEVWVKHSRTRYARAVDLLDPAVVIDQLLAGENSAVFLHE
jgi:hypothetical protein